jgi:hypothetical protein
MLLASLVVEWETTHIYLWAYKFFCVTQIFSPLYLTIFNVYSQGVILYEFSFYNTVSL